LAYDVHPRFSPELENHSYYFWQNGSDNIVDDGPCYRKRTNKYKRFLISYFFLSEWRRHGEYLGEKGERNIKTTICTAKIAYGNWIFLEEPKSIKLIILHLVLDGKLLYFSSAGRFWELQHAQNYLNPNWQTMNMEDRNGL